jgi:hypothetical protein
MIESAYHKYSNKTLPRQLTATSEDQRLQHISLSMLPPPLDLRTFPLTLSFLSTILEHHTCFLGPNPSLFGGVADWRWRKGSAGGSFRIGFGLFAHSGVGRRFSAARSGPRVLRRERFAPLFGASRSKGYHHFFNKAAGCSRCCKAFLSFLSWSAMAARGRGGRSSVGD